MFARPQQAARSPAIARENEYSWTHAPCRIASRRAQTVAAAGIVSFFTAFALFHSLLFALAALAVLTLAIADRVLPQRYRLTNHGVTVTIFGVTTLEMAWTDVQCVSSVRGGVKLSCFENPTTARLESTRGVTLRYPSSLAMEIEPLVRKHRRLA